MAAALIATSTGTVVAMAVGGIVSVIVISAVFYAIGRGEDRDRAEAARRRAEAAAGGGEAPAAGGGEAPAAGGGEAPAAGGGEAPAAGALREEAATGEGDAAPASHDRRLQSGPRPRRRR